MNLIVQHVDVWAAAIDDKPGALAEVLTVLQQAGADLQSVISRRAPEEPGKGVVFVTPLQGDAETAAAAQAGFNVTQVLHSVRVIGTNLPGALATLTQKLADEGINLRGFSSSTIGSRFVAYVAVDSLHEAQRAIATLESA